MKLVRFSAVGMPRAALNSFGLDLKSRLEPEIFRMLEESARQDEQRDTLSRQAKTVQHMNAQIKFCLKLCDFESIGPLIEASNKAISEVLSTADFSQRERMSDSITENAESRLLEQFFSSGTLAPLSAIQPCSDEEYISAVLGFAQEVSRYCVGRACEGDVASIATARSVVSKISEKMLEFNFRNGNLRRKFDGLKYALRSIENITYELSLLGDVSPEAAPTESASSTKRIRLEEYSSRDLSSGARRDQDVTPTSTPLDPLDPLDPLVDVGEFDQIRRRVDAVDALREDVIKQSRDIQKLSKQAIFAVQRGNTADANAKLQKARSVAAPLLEIIQQHPTLRHGALSNSLEEWAEGMLTAEWYSHQRILTKTELAIVDTGEYVGALSDFTGEIGRLAIACASKRDLEGVRRVLQADIVVWGAIMQLNASGRFAKKNDAVMMNLKKVEDVVYDLCMLERGGRTGRPKEVVPDPKEEVERDSIA